MSEESRLLVINIRRKLVATPHKKRSKKAIDLVRSHVKRHMKGEDMIIDQSLNELIWSKGSERPPSKLTVQVEKDEEGRLIIKALK